VTVVKAFFSMAACLPLAPLAPAESLPPGTAIAVHIDFSPESRTFLHKIDSQIDHERAKVV
jgi:hypothetical protein